jgi:hypothetical protein
MKTEVPELELKLRRELRLDYETHLKTMERKDSPSEVMMMEEESKEEVVQWGEEVNSRKEV